jgi:ABC-type amino acid transport substrate-binding protein
MGCCSRVAILLLFLPLYLFSVVSYSQDVITMVYREAEKLPYIDAAPSNKGLYQAVFKEAAKKIGLRFQIKRLPKKRAYNHLENGYADFYPGASFVPDREHFGYFIENGMALKGSALLYDNDLTVNNVSEIKGYTLLYNMGGTTSFYEYSGVDLTSNYLREVPSLDIKKAIKILQKKQADFYAYDITAINNYFKAHDVKGIKRLSVPLDEKVDHLIFSKRSDFYHQKSNPSYNPSKELAIKNLPYTVDENSIAYKFQQAIKSMQVSGEIDRLYQEILMSN